MLLIVGLGNPGKRYAGTRHNIGFMALDEIVRRQNLRAGKRRFHSETAEGPIGREKVLALKPQTLMNRSGDAVGDAARFFKLGPERIIVLHDELDLAPGKLRVKRGGGNAGHNGLKSIDARVGNGFTRVRLGIGHPGDKNQVTGYVLSPFTKADRAWVEPLCEAVGEAIPRLADGDAAGFTSDVAARVPPPDAGSSSTTNQG